jgi:uncharacterized protein (TIGR00730 family)
MMVFVGESSREPKDKCFEDAAKAIGEFIARKGHDFVFGGCNRGMMGITYREVEKNPNCKVYAVVDEAYESDLQDIEYQTAYVLESLHLRKDTIFKLADVTVFLPGGIGTIDEFMTAIEMKRTDKYKGQIVVANVNKYYYSLIRQLCHSRWNEFSEDIDRYCRIFPNIDETISYLERMT